MKKALICVLTCTLIILLFACQKSETPAATVTDGDSIENTEVTGLQEAFAEYPALVTSCGQSADYQIVATVMTKLDMDFETNNLVTSADLDGFKTLIVVVGGSSKGLGAAGIDADDELARIGELLDAAKDQEIKIIVMHTGGASRRGDLSDKFISPALSNADYAIVVTSGDEDGFMADICKTNGIPMDYIDSISDVLTALPVAFK